MPPPLHALLPLLLLSASTTAAVYATTNGTRTLGARHLVQTNRLQNLRTDVELLLWKASNSQYAAAQAGTRPTPYVVNKEIARSMREALQIWYGPDAANLRLIQDELHLGEEGPRGSGEDLRLFWNVAVSNIIPPSQFRNLRIRTAPDKIVVVPLVPGDGHGMPTDRPCDKDIVPDICAESGGLVSVQLNLIVTAGGSSEVWPKKAVVFISRRNEFTFGADSPSAASTSADLPAPKVNPAEQAYIKLQSDNIMGDFRECMTEQVKSYLPLLELTDALGIDPPSPVSLTQIADCMSDLIAAPERLGAPPRGIFISQKDRLHNASISAMFAGCTGHQISSSCIDAPEQSFGKGHVIAHVLYQYSYPNRLPPFYTAFFYAVLLPPRSPSP